MLTSKDWSIANSKTILNIENEMLQNVNDLIVNNPIQQLAGKNFKTEKFQHLEQATIFYIYTAFYYFHTQSAKYITKEIPMQNKFAILLAKNLLKSFAAFSVEHNFDVLSLPIIETQALAVEVGTILGTFAFKPYKIYDNIMIDRPLINSLSEDLKPFWKLIKNTTELESFYENSDNIEFQQYNFDRLWGLINNSQEFQIFWLNIENNLMNNNDFQIFWTKILWKSISQDEINKDVIQNFYNILLKHYNINKEKFISLTKQLNDIKDNSFDEIYEKAWEELDEEIVSELIEEEYLKLTFSEIARKKELNENLLKNIQNLLGQDKVNEKDFENLIYQALGQQITSKNLSKGFVENLLKQIIFLQIYNKKISKKELEDFFNLIGKNILNQFDDLTLPGILINPHIILKALENSCTGIKIISGTMKEDDLHHQDKIFISDHMYKLFHNLSLPILLENSNKYVHLIKYWTYLYVNQDLSIYENFPQILDYAKEAIYNIIRLNQNHQFHLWENILLMKSQCPDDKPIYSYNEILTELDQFNVPETEPKKSFSSKFSRPTTHTHQTEESKKSSSNIGHGRL